MGGGDLNSKKSWHPNTMKNQERVWKAEQAAAEEKKRIQELQRERAEERDRAELNEMAKRSAGTSVGDNRLHWMYDDKPNKSTQQEEYLLGKTIDKNYDRPEKDQEIPAVVRRVVGSSMTKMTDDSQVDLARKVREDPLLLVKERERAARAALLNNPLHRKKLTELLRKEQDQKKELKSKKAKKKSDLDSQLAAKLSSLGGNKGVDLAALLASDDSSSSSDEDEKHTKKKKKHVKSKKSKKSKERKKSTSDLDSGALDVKASRKHLKYDDKSHDCKSKYKNKYDSDSEEDRSKLHKTTKPESRKRKSDDYDSEVESRHKRKVDMSGLRKTDRDPKRHKSSDDDDDKRSKKRRSSPHSYRRMSPSKRRMSPDSRSMSKRKKSPYNQRRVSPDRKKFEAETNYKPKKTGLSDEERAKRLAEMAAAGAEREIERERRVARQRVADAKESEEHRRPRVSKAHALPDSLESRIHSNRHYIQRDKRHMNENFARR